MEVLLPCANVSSLILSLIRDRSKAIQFPVNSSLILPISIEELPYLKIKANGSTIKFLIGPACEKAPYVMGVTEVNCLTEMPLVAVCDMGEKKKIFYHERGKNILLNKEYEIDFPSWGEIIHFHHYDMNYAVKELIVTTLKKNYKSHIDLFYSCTYR